MKILKPGKVEQRKFVCPDCESVLLIGRYEESVCPVCRERLHWNNGEPYEEPTHSDRERLASLIRETPDVTVWPDALSRIAKHLIANGVTFREG